jgi:hypothetical protein
MKANDDFPSIRLAAAGFVSLLLLGWVGVWYQDFWSVFNFTRHAIDEEPFSLTVTVGLALSILLILIPVLWRGAGMDRWLAVLLTFFPLSLFAVAAVSGLLIRA